MNFKAKAKTSGGDTYVQDWLARRIRSISDGIIVRGDGVPLAVICIEPVAMALLSEREQALRVQGVHEALQGVAGQWQMIDVQRPVDLDDYVEHLTTAVRDADSPARRTAARGYLGYVRDVVGSGQATEQRHYVLLGHDPRQPAWKAAEAHKAAADLVAALGRAGTQAHPAAATEIRDMLLAYLQPDRRADDTATEPSGITVWGGRTDGSNGTA